MKGEFSSFHDARLVGAHVLKLGDQLRLEIEDGESHTSLLFTGVKAFRLVDMQTQNIIYRLKKYSGSSVGDDEIKKILQWISSCVDSASYMTEETILRYIYKIGSGELSLVVLEPSGGAELAVLCAAFESQKGPLFCWS